MNCARLLATFMDRMIFVPMLFILESKSLFIFEMNVQYETNGVDLFILEIICTLHFCSSFKNVFM